MKTYAEKLKDPRWQKKRLQIMERDNFTCQGYHEQCEGKELHIHHIHYIKGAMPWEYDDSYLITLCNDCHELIENQKANYLKLSPDPQSMLTNSYLLENFNCFRPYSRALVYDLAISLRSLTEEGNFEDLKDVYVRIKEIIDNENKKLDED